MISIINQSCRPSEKKRTERGRQTERTREKGLAQEIQAGRNRLRLPGQRRSRSWLLEHLVQSLLLCPSVLCLLPALLVQPDLVLDRLSHCSSWFSVEAPPRSWPVATEAWSGNSALCAGMWLRCELNNPIGKLAWPLINSCCLCVKTMAKETQNFS